MTVNIVYTGKGRNDVLDRQAQALADATGWAYNRYPVDACEWNHFICYVEFGEKYSDWHKTKVSAWFTHYEQHVPYKAFWWELAANNVDLRLVTSRQYLAPLSELGPTALARPAIDPQFTIGTRGPRDVPRVGVAGYVHPGGRKGERLLAQLAGSEYGLTLQLVGAGRGWPVRCNEYPWSDLPLYYNSLDVFVCTSTIEGVPMPPLEALACGVKVVIPRGVGLLDDLPDVAGIVRYDAGDYDALEAAVREAVDVQADRKALREAVQPYNADNWAADHRMALAGVVAEAQIESDRHGRRGVYYVAYGEPARLCAKGAIAAFREHMPGIEVAAVSSEPLGVEDVFIHCEDRDIGGRYAKTRIYELAPMDWQYVLYMDADTQVVANISFLYDVLIDGWDMVICKNPAKYHLAREMMRSDNHDECERTFTQIGTSELIQLNGGVFAFQRNERTRQFFSEWHREWQKWGKRDQGALLRALYMNPVKLYVLDNYPWNAITRYEAREDVCVKHWPMTARRWRGKVVERSDSAEAWAKVKQYEKGQGQ